MLQAHIFEAIADVAHGFFGREGGAANDVSESLNISTNVGDDRDAVTRTRAAMLRAAGLGEGRFLSLSQVHGDTIVQVTRGAYAAIEADGFWTRDNGLALCVQTADCVPLLFADVDGRAVGAVHAGWRGTQKNIATAMVQRFAAAGIAQARLRVALGPAIGPCCFTVGYDVAQALQRCTPQAASFVQAQGEAWAGDLWGLNAAQLVAAGVAPQHIEALRLCTRCDTRFFSHRRSQGKCGRQGSVIGLQPLKN